MLTGSAASLEQMGTGGGGVAGAHGGTFSA